jgi:hypothetical protein
MSLNTHQEWVERQPTTPAAQQFLRYLGVLDALL